MLLSSSFQEPLSDDEGSETTSYVWETVDIRQTPTKCFIPPLTGAPFNGSAPRPSPEGRSSPANASVSSNDARQLTSPWKFR
jgi:hypothetical protein